MIFFVLVHSLRYRFFELFYCKESDDHAAVYIQGDLFTSEAGSIPFLGPLPVKNNLYFYSTALYYFLCFLYFRQIFERFFYLLIRIFIILKFAAQISIIS